MKKWITNYGNSDSFLGLFTSRLPADFTSEEHIHVFGAWIVKQSLNFSFNSLRVYCPGSKIRSLKKPLKHVCVEHPGIVQHPHNDYLGINDLDDDAILMI